MTVPTNRLPLDVVSSADLNALAAAINALQVSLNGKQAAGSYITQQQLDIAIGGRAASEHNHSGNQIQGGVLPSNVLPNATTSVIGASELATNAEANTGTDNSRVITPAALKYVSGQQYIRKDNEAGTWNFGLFGDLGGQANLGNSTVENWFLRIGDVVIFGLTLIIGSTFSGANIGTWMPNLPVMPHQGYSNQGINLHVTSAGVVGGGVPDGTGSGKIENNGQQRITRSFVKNNLTTVNLRLQADRDWGTGDRIMWSGAYKCQ